MKFLCARALETDERGRGDAVAVTDAMRRPFSTGNQAIQKSHRTVWFGAESRQPVCQADVRSLAEVVKGFDSKPPGGVGEWVQVPRADVVRVRLSSGE
ncbi:hypothetical protein GN958_ATG20498 [Phytophthora infestans]|uniref:Uncharacterized protein n=1 Tax=Phytophthora infestans TaxID=4787 RepID=A0A8S9TMZ8_PHYIN|nr:hypothetical protein GN958_ATG20498 [Phytophthora infestans]